MLHVHNWCNIRACVCAYVTFQHVMVDSHYRPIIWRSCTQRLNWWETFTMGLQRYGNISRQMFDVQHSIVFTMGFQRYGNISHQMSDVEHSSLRWIAQHRQLCTTGLLLGCWFPLNGPAKYGTPNSRMSFLRRRLVTIDSVTKRDAITLHNTEHPLYTHWEYSVT